MPRTAAHQLALIIIKFQTLGVVFISVDGNRGVAAPPSPVHPTQWAESTVQSEFKAKLSKT